MRRIVFAAVAAFCFVAAADAQEAQKFRVFTYLSEPSYAQAGGESHWGGTLGVGLSYALDQRWSLALSAGYETRRFRATYIDPAALSVDRKHRVFPYDLTARHHFRNDSRWQPYVGAGVFAARLPNESGLDRWTVAPELNGGVTFALTPRLGLDIDGKRLLRDELEGADLRRLSIGLSWRF